MEDYQTNPEEVPDERNDVLKFALGALKGAVFGGICIGIAEGIEVLGSKVDIKEAAFAALVVTVGGGIEEVRGAPILRLPRRGKNKDKGI